MSTTCDISESWRGRLERALPGGLEALLSSAARPALPGDLHGLSKAGLGGRRRWRWTPGESGESKDGTLFIKQYQKATLREQWDRIWRQTTRHSRAWWEYQQARRLADAAIPAARAVAFVERMVAGFESRSAVILEQVPGRPMDAAIRELSSAGAAGCRGMARFDLARRVGRFVAAVHETGLCHRDLYLCHIFAEIDPAGRVAPRFALIDLARAHRPRWRRMRWLLKDLSQLDYSAGQTGISRTDRYRTLLAYLGLERGAPRARWYARRIVERSERIRRRELRKGRGR